MKNAQEQMAGVHAAIAILEDAGWELRHIYAGDQVESRSATLVKDGVRIQIRPEPQNKKED